MKRKSTGYWMSGLLGLTVAMMATASLAQLESEVAVDVPVLSSYVWRGMVLNDEAVLQPGLTGSIGGFSVNAWSSMDLTDSNGASGEFTEMDWTVSYAQAFGIVELGAGVIAYTFPGVTVESEAEDGTVTGEAAAGTTEIFASVAVDTLLAPALTVYYDVDEIEGFYAVASIGHSFGLLDNVGLDLSVSLGFGGEDYNAGYFGYEDAALNDLLLGAALAIAITENISVTPSISYMMLPDSDLEEAAEAAYGEKDSVYGGVSLSCAF